MSKLLLLVVALVGLCGAAPPKKGSVSEQPAQQVAPAPPPPPSYAPYPDQNAESCYEADNHDSADLCAQWRAAVGAEKAADAAWYSVGVDGVGALFSLISIGLVVYALLQTNKSLKIAHKDRATATRRAITQSEETEIALKHAEASANAMRRQTDLTAEAQRAWMSLRALPKLIRPQGIDGLYIQIDFEALNVGQSIATHMCLDYKLYFLGKGQDTQEIDRQMADQIERWKSEHIAGRTAILPQGQVEHGSIWDSYDAKQVKWVDAPMLGRTVNPMVLVAAFYRTVSAPDKVQVNWRSWYLGSVDDEGHPHHWIKKPPFSGWREQHLFVSYFRNSLMHEEYAAPPDDA